MSARDVTRLVALRGSWHTLLRLPSVAFAMANDRETGFAKTFRFKDL